MQVLDKTQWVGGSWRWESWMGSQPNLSWVRSTNERFGWDPIKRSHELGSTHSLGFVFILVCFPEYICIKIDYFHLIYYQLFLYSKNSSSFITTRKMFDITAPWHHSKQPLLWDNGYVMMSKQLGDITMGRWHCHWYQTTWILYQWSR